MKITSEKDQQSQYVVRIEIEPTEFEEAKGRAAKKLSNQLRIPGFRPGKAPRALVERFVGQEGLIEQATKDLLPKAYENALKQEDIRPIADPQFDIESTDPLTIRVIIPVEPTVELGQYQDIRFELKPTNVAEEEVDKVLEQLIEQQSTWEEPETERPAQEGDQVELDMRTIRDGEETGEPFQRTGVLGKGELLGQIDEQVQGMSVGEERTVEVKRTPPAKPETTETSAAEETETTSDEAATTVVEPAQELAEVETAATEPAQELPEVETIPLDEEEAEDSTPMTFKVKLNSVKVQHRPEVNDEFAQSVTDVQTLDELKERIRQNLRDQQENTNKRELTEKVIKEAVALSNIVMPPVMVDAEIHALEDSMAQRLKQQKLSLDQYLSMVGQSHEQFHEELRPQAEDRIRTALVLREIARRENVTVEQTDLDREVERMVDQYTLSAPEDQRETQAATMRTYLKQDQTLNQMRDDLFSRKLSERLITLSTGGTVTTGPVDEADEPEIVAELNPGPAGDAPEHEDESEGVNQKNLEADEAAVAKLPVLEPGSPEDESHDSTFDNEADSPEK